MGKIHIMPDLPMDYIRYLYNNPDYMIFKEQYFIKRIFIGRKESKESINIETLADISDLNIDGFNNHKRMFIDDCEQFIYLNAPYLANHQDMITSLQKMNIQDKLSSFKYLFNHLNLAHQNELNPFDIKFSNYLMSLDNKPIFIDFDFCFYQGKCTLSGAPNTIFQLNNFTKNNSIDDSKVLNLNDKMLALKMLFQALSGIYEWKKYDDINILRESYLAFIKNYNIDPEVDNYIRSILYDFNTPKEDDYFIDTIVDPLLDGGITLKKCNK
ncbi:MAG: hypothetical protein ACI31M_02785 [Bacilli bacterium]